MVRNNCRNYDKSKCDISNSKLTQEYTCHQFFIQIKAEKAFYTSTRMRKG